MFARGGLFRVLWCCYPSQTFGGRVGARLHPGGVLFVGECVPVLTNVEPGQISRGN
jgi:hypothetical protein